MNKTKYTLDDFGRGQQVNVFRKEGDQFNHDFTGTVYEITDRYVIVQDQDGDCWSCDPDQLGYNTDEIMHEGEDL